MSQRNNLKPWIVSGVWALAITALMGVALFGVSWAFVDVYNNFYKATAFTWGETFASAIHSGAVVATQFHPEKSQQAGLRLLGNFLGVGTPVEA